MAQDLFSKDELNKIIDEDLLDLMGAKNMPGDAKAALYEKMALTIQDRVLLRIDEMLDEEGRKQFAAVIDSGDQVKTNDFLLSKNIGVPQLLIQEAMLYKVEIMSLMKLSKQNKQ